MTLITAPQLVTSQETPEGHRDSQQDPPTKAPKMRFHVSPFSLVGGLAVTAATHAAGDSAGLDVAVVTGVFGTTAVVLGQLIPWWLNRRTQKRELALSDRLMTENARLQKRNEELEDELDSNRRKPRGR